MEEQSRESSKLLERITMNPEICHGKPCIRSLRYPVDMILELLSAGMSNEEILADYDDLELEDILAALAFPRAFKPDEARAGCAAMKFVVDAQLPERVARWLQRAFATGALCCRNEG